MTDPLYSPGSNFDLPDGCTQREIDGRDYDEDADDYCPDHNVNGRCRECEEVESWGNRRRLEE